MLLRELRNLISFKHLSPFHWLIIFIAFFTLHIPAIRNDHGNTNAYELLGKSFLQGKLSIDVSELPLVKGSNIPDTGDLSYYNGKYYLPYPPGPALLLLPFLLIAGGFVNSVLIAVLISCLNIYLLYKILIKIGVKDSQISWLIYGFFFGTSYWYVLLSSHHVYGFAEVVSVMGLLLLFNELFGKSRPGILGIFLGLSFLSRQFAIIMFLFVIAYYFYKYLIISEQKNAKLFYKKSINFSLVLGISVIYYFFYNYHRFGSPLDTGYGYIAFIGLLKDRVDQYGVFSSHYVLYNLYNYLLKGFNIEFIGKGFLKIKDVDLYGTALLIASPFLISAFKTGWNKFLRTSAWVVIGIIFTGLLFYHNNGKDQVNASRFTLDFLPLMYIMVGLGTKNIPSWLFKCMVTFSILLNVVAISVHFAFHTLAK